MRDTALFPITAYSQRLQSSGKHTETERGGEGRREGDRQWEGDKRDFRGEGEGYKPFNRDVLYNNVG